MPPPAKMKRSLQNLLLALLLGAPLAAALASSRLLPSKASIRLEAERTAYAPGSEAAIATSG